MKIIHSYQFSRAVHYTSRVLRVIITVLFYQISCLFTYVFERVNSCRNLIVLGRVDIVFERVVSFEYLFVLVCVESKVC